MRLLQEAPRKLQDEKNEALPQRLWRWFVAPSQQITSPDQRRQASLLSAFLLGIIVLAIIVETAAVALIQWEDYTGYRQTIIGVVILMILYFISRTRHARLAAILSVVILSAYTFYSGWAEPKGVLGGFFDFLILPLWLGSLYLSVKELSAFIVANLVGLLIFPYFTSQVTLNDILVGPFSFLFATSILLIVITRNRNLMEQDRQAELKKEETQSRRQAARAEALLRVADRLNAHLDLDTLLEAISEEVTRAFDVPVSLVALYDQRENVFYPTTVKGVPSDFTKQMKPFPKGTYDQTIKEFGTVFTLPDIQVFPRLPNLDVFREMQLRSLAFATMKYEQELIGSLTAITSRESRNFTEEELLLLQGLADQAALAINNTRLYKDARRRLEHLQALRAIDIAISTNRNLQKTLNVVLEQITEQLQVDAAVILLLDSAKQQLQFGVSRGFITSALSYTNLRMGEGMAGRAALQRETFYVRDLTKDPKFLINAASLVKEGFVSYFAAPLISKDKVEGVLEIFHRSVLDPDNEWLNFLETLAGQAAIAVENTTLFEDLQRTNAELVQAYDATIEGWSHALDLRDKETEGHTQRVTKLTLELAQFFGYAENDMIYLRWGALLHDIGKMGVPDQILLKEGPLNEREWEIMRQHPVYAHEMLRTIQYLRPALDIPYCHHEKWDGTGYPRKLKQEEIPLAARIFAVVDVWDALTSDRPYRPAWTREKAFSYIQEESGHHFDPHVVDVFTKWITKKQPLTDSHA